MLTYWITTMCTNHITWPGNFILLYPFFLTKKVVSTVKKLNTPLKRAKTNNNKIRVVDL